VADSHHAHKERNTQADAQCEPGGAGQKWSDPVVALGDTLKQAGEKVGFKPDGGDSRQRQQKQVSSSDVGKCNETKAACGTDRGGYILICKCAGTDIPPVAERRPLGVGRCLTD